jgi:hypothetical protein
MPASVGPAPPSSPGTDLLIDGGVIATLRADRVRVKAVRGRSQRAHVALAWLLVGAAAAAGISASIR